MFFYRSGCVGCEKLYMKRCFDEGSGPSPRHALTPRFKIAEQQDL